MTKKKILPPPALAISLRQGRTTIPQQQAQEAARLLPLLLGIYRPVSRLQFRPEAEEGAR